MSTTALSPHHTPHTTHHTILHTHTHTHTHTHAHTPGVYHASGTELYSGTAEAGAWYTPVRPAREGQGVDLGLYGLGLGSQRRVSHTFGNISDVGNGTYTGTWTLDIQVQDSCSCSYCR